MSSSRITTPIGRPSLDAMLLQVVDGCLAGAIFLVPLFLGGRHAVGHLIFTVLAVTAALACAARRCLGGNGDEAGRFSRGAVALAAGGLALLILQLAPLPPRLLQWLSPHLAEVLPLWQPAGTTPGALGAWNRISLAPTETMTGLVLFLNYALLFFAAADRIKRQEDVERLLRWCAMSAVAMAVLGIVQLLAGNGKFLWFYEHPFTMASGVARGSFANRNHFAQFLALGLGPLIWWLQDAAGRRKSRHSRAADEHRAYLLTLALGVVLFAGLLSLSRGGAVSMFLAAGLCATVCYRAAALSGRFVAGLAFAGLLIGGALAIFGYEQVNNRLSDLWSGSVEQLDRDAGRRKIWAASIRAVPDFPLLGAGVGSFPNVHPMYTNALPDEGVEYKHADNCYLERALETGLVGLGLSLAGIGLAAAWCLRGLALGRSVRQRTCMAALAASFAAAAAHAMVDFVWYMPACLVVVVVLAACAMRINRDERREERGEKAAIFPSPLTSLLSPLLVLALLPLGVWMISSRIGPAVAQTYWDDYLRAWRKAEARGSAEASPLNDPTVQRGWIACLENAIRWQPTHARARLALAETHLRLFHLLQADSENAMSLANLRDAAIRSQFPSREALISWLGRAVGDHRTHLDQALHQTLGSMALNPLQGRGYLYLADLAFLAGGGAQVQKACLDQALRVRPHDGAVLYAAASAALLDGNAELWWDYAQRAFHSGRRQQRQFLADLAANMPVEQLPAVIDFLLRQLDPDLEAMRCLYAACAKRCGPEPLVPLLCIRAERARKEAAERSGAEAAPVWLEAGALYGQLGDQQSAVECFHKAVQSDPNSYQAHYRLAMLLLREGQFAEAEGHLRWCANRRPSDASVQNHLRAALKGRLESQRRAAAENPVSR